MGIYSKKTESLWLSTGLELVYRGPKVTTREDSLFLKTGKFFNKFFLSLTHLGLDPKSLFQPK